MHLPWIISLCQLCCWQFKNTRKHADSQTQLKAVSGLSTDHGRGASVNQPRVLMCKIRLSVAVMSHIADSFRQVENAVFCMLLFFSQKWYDTIRDAISTCAEKLTWVSLIYCLEPTTKKWNDASACAINCVSANSLCPNLCVHTMNTNIIGRCMWWLELQTASTPAAVTVLISLSTPRTTILLVDVLWWHLL